MRVLIITPAFPPGMHVGGGVAITYKVLSEKLAQIEGVNPVVLSTWNGRLDYFHTRLDPEFRLIKPSFQNLRLLQAEMAASDVIICPDNLILPWIAMEGRRLGKPTIWVLHTNFLRIAAHRLTALEAKFFEFSIHIVFNVMSRLFRHVLTTSRDYLQFMQERHYRIEGYINQGFKTAVFEELDSQDAIMKVRLELTMNKPERPVIMFAGRFSNEKRIDLLLKAKPDNFVLVLVGDGYLRDQLAELHDMEQGIVVIDRMVPQQELRLFYKASNLVVSASDFETYGMTIHEGLVCGTPAVVQDAKGFRQQIRNGVNGFLIDYSDSETAKRKLQEAVYHPFSNVKPLKDPDCIELVDFIQQRALASKDVQPAGFLTGIALTLFQLGYIFLANLAATFYGTKPPSHASRLPSAPPSAKPKKLRKQD